MNSIKKFREAKGLMQKDLAERLGLDRSTITKWETGETSPRSDMLPEIAKILGCEIGELFEKDTA